VIYIPKEDVERIEKGCDLGDWVNVSAYVYPHRDSIPDLARFYTEEEFQKVVDQNARRYEGNVELLKQIDSLKENSRRKDRIIIGLESRLRKENLCSKSPEVLSPKISNKNLKFALEYLDISVEDFAKEMNIGRDTAEALVNGSRVPDFEIVWKTLDILPIKMEKLLQ